MIFIATNKIPKHIKMTYSVEVLGRHATHGGHVVPGLQELVSVLLQVQGGEPGPQHLSVLGY